MRRVQSISGGVEHPWRIAAIRQVGVEQYERIAVAARVVTHVDDQAVRVAKLRHPLLISRSEDAFTILVSRKYPTFPSSTREPAGGHTEAGAVVASRSVSVLWPSPFLEASATSTVSLCGSFNRSRMKSMLRARDGCTSSRISNVCKYIDISYICKW